MEAFVLAISEVSSAIQVIKNSQRVIKNRQKMRKRLVLSLLLSQHVKSSPIVWMLPRSKGYFEKVYSWPPDHFHKEFRMNQDSFDIIVADLHPFLVKIKTSREQLSVQERVAMGLYCLKSGSDYRCVAATFGISPTSVCRVLDEFLDAVIEKYLNGAFKFPSTPAEQEEAAKQYLFKWQFPGCIGSLDGMHFPIKAPEKDGADYYNYKNWHSVLLLAVCDANYRITYLNTGYPGKVSDGGAFSTSTLGQKVRDGGLINEPYCLIGDAAFPLLPGLMKGYPGTNLTPEKAHFNYRISRPRMSIECVFGRVQGRWRIMMKRCDLGIKKAIKVSTVCCILHNFLEDRKEVYLNQWDDNFYEGIFPQPAEVMNEEDYFDRGEFQAKEKRDMICELLQTTYPM